MAQLPIQQIIRTGSGLEPTYVAAEAGGDEFTNEAGRIFAILQNGSSGTIVVTADVKGQVDGLDVIDPTYSIPLGEDRMIGSFPKSYEDSDGNVNLTYDGVDVAFKIAIIRL